MATVKQEQIYNEIIEYYNYSNQLIALVDEVKHDFSNEQFAIIEQMIENLEKYTDELSAEYIEFVKNGASDETANKIRDILNNILIRTEECRNKIKMLYSKKI